MRSRRRKCLPLFYLVAMLSCIASMLFVFFSVEVSYFLGVQIRPFAFPATAHDAIHDRCKEVHIAMVVGGFETAAASTALIKSILFYHQGLIHFHFITDSRSRSVLPRLFETWRLPDVRVDFYKMEEFVNRVSWVPNKHYSQNFGMVKLLLPDILPLNVHKTNFSVLLLDSDVLLINSIDDLLAHHDRMNSSQIYAMVENMSGWYTTAEPTNRKWPALGRGFNSGVALVNVQRMRNMDWDALWKKVANEHLKTRGTTMLADQDILNAMFKEYPELVHKLPCENNVQMGLLSLPEMCTLDAHKVKIVHWNSPKKTRTRNRYAAFFLKKYTEFAKLDGNAFRLRRTCDVKERRMDNDESLSYVYEYDEFPDDCGTFATASRHKQRTHAFVRDYDYVPIPGDVTLVTQFSIDRLEVFEEVVNEWPGPISAAVYTTDADLAELRDYLKESPATSKRKNIALHAIFKESAFYPINYLRNVALNASSTEFVYLVDVDFVPSPDLYLRLQSTLRSDSLNMTKKALVVPAFEKTQKEFAPRNKQELLEMVDGKKVKMFREEVWPRGHLPTDYEKWIQTNSSYQVQWKADYEPYVVVRRSNVPLYDERFVGFGWNKVTHIMTLHAAGYSFEVLPDVFTIHSPHPPSFEITKYRSSALYRKCMKTLRGEFARDLYLKYGGGKPSSSSTPSS